jgi:hypothetical protein
MRTENVPFSRSVARKETGEPARETPLSSLSHTACSRRLPLLPGVVRRQADPDLLLRVQPGAQRARTDSRRPLDPLPRLQQRWRTDPGAHRFHPSRIADAGGVHAPIFHPARVARCSDGADGIVRRRPPVAAVPRPVEADVPAVPVPRPAFPRRTKNEVALSGKPRENGRNVSPARVKWIAPVHASAAPASGRSRRVDSLPAPCEQTPRAEWNRYGQVL